MKKLIIQIPCFNEEFSLPVTLKNLPKKVAGFDKVEFLIIDDGSSDNTINVAKVNGVKHIISFTKNQGLAKAFMAGINESLRLGADVIINTDADNQYNAKDIPNLVKPILQNRADIVVGARPISSIEHFSLSKKFLQKLGSLVIRIVSNTNISDAPSGFRAFSKDAALKLNVYSNYTYTLETLIQAGQKNLKVVSIPISVNRDMRPSKLVKSIPSYIRRSIVTIVRIFVVYRPFRFFVSLGIFFISLGLITSIRFIFLYQMSHIGGHIQSLILAAILFFIGFLLVVTGFIGDLIAVNRKLLEDIQYQLRKKN